MRRRKNPYSRFQLELPLPLGQATAPQKSAPDPPPDPESPPQLQDLQDTPTNIIPAVTPLGHAPVTRNTPTAPYGTTHEESIPEKPHDESAIAATPVLQTDPSTSQPWKLELPRPALLTAFRAFRRIHRQDWDEHVILTFNGTRLHFESPDEWQAPWRNDVSRGRSPGVIASTEAQGHWPGRVHIQAYSLFKLARLPPEGDPLELSVKCGRLHIGCISLSCTVHTK